MDVEGGGAEVAAPPRVRPVMDSIRAVHRRRVAGFGGGVLVEGFVGGPGELEGGGRVGQQPERLGPS